MEDIYRSIEKPAEGIFRDRNSRFLAFGFPVRTVEEINEILAGIRKKYHDARHHCYAYRLGSDKDVFRMNDDGEPSGTAGKPIFGQLLSFDLTNTLVIVVRYFGGTLLGTSGLKNAYRSASADMLAHASLVTKYVEEGFRIRFPYDRLNAVMKILKEENLIPVQPDYNTLCSMNIIVRKSHSGILTTRLSGVPGLAYESIQIAD
jgi:uncharacterized YigZ family protein